MQDGVGAAVLTIFVSTAEKRRQHSAVRTTWLPLRTQAVCTTGHALRTPLDRHRTDSPTPTGDSDWTTTRQMLSCGVPRGWRAHPIVAVFRESVCDERYRWIIAIAARSLCSPVLGGGEVAIVEIDVHVG